MTVVVDVSTFKDIHNDKELAAKLLEEENIAILPLTIFGGSENGFRLLTCCKPEVYKELINRLKSFNERNQKA